MIFWLGASYDFERLKTEQNSFQQTLKTARLNGNEFETATITEKVINFNINLAQKKLRNKYFLLTDYIDDRIETLKPIE